MVIALSSNAVPLSNITQVDIHITSRHMGSSNVLLDGNDNYINIRTHKEQIIMSFWRWLPGYTGRFTRGVVRVMKEMGREWAAECREKWRQIRESPGEFKETVRIAVEVFSTPEFEELAGIFFMLFFGTLTFASTIEIIFKTGGEELLLHSMSLVISYLIFAHGKYRHGV